MLCLIPILCTNIISHIQVEMTGSSMFDYVHIQDHQELAEQLGLNNPGIPSSSTTSSSSATLASNSNSNANTATTSSDQDQESTSSSRAVTPTVPERCKCFCNLMTKF